MKRFLILLALVCAWAALPAQSIREVKELFGDFATKNANTTETIISGKALENTGLSFYRSLVISGAPEKADAITRRIGRLDNDALSREVKYINGKIYYAMFTLQPEGRDRDNHYLFYLNSHLKGDDRIILIYISGTRNVIEINDLLK
ncbi:MAG: hypothetical protein K2L05_00810 [Muribaculaceae bacterium]|nr:hypothetical protein [Muribaculaceae bacterium]MDE7335743.1 hypothetical protein [Muribaculaceae bacterium]